MALLSGTHLGPYVISSLIGAGGMGEVYKGIDTRLNRTVAIKVLPAHLSDRPELRERLEREARVVASLNHPHIAVLYDIGREQETEFLVMEYLDGETLADRLKKGPVPLDQALRHAIDIADALDKAHRQGIAHRDVKPSNIMLTKSGAKLLDFGLAKGGVDAPTPTPLSQLPTDANLTSPGAILGTLQYMSPEQLEGRQADARSDIFCFGTTLYEMITGKKAFEGKSQVSLMAAILEDEPQSIASLQPLSPPLLDRLIRKCLAKDPASRWQSAADLVEGLEWIRESPAVAQTVSRPATLKKTATLFALAVALVAGLIVILVRSPDIESPLWFSVMLPEGNLLDVPGFAVSPDGESIAFTGPTKTGVDSLWVKRFDSPEARELAGTAGAQLPFWAPDSQSIGFFAGGKLLRVDIAGSVPQVLAPASNTRGGTWGLDGSIIFAPAPSGGLLRISASGGTPTPLTFPDNAVSFQFPHFLPDGKRYLYWQYHNDTQLNGVYVGSLDGMDAKRLSGVSSKAEFAAGNLVYSQGADLFIRRFDVDRLEFTGNPTRVASGIGFMYGDPHNRAFSSSNGSLAFNSQPGAFSTQLTWFDRFGKRLEPLGDPGEIYGVTVSPDQKIAALEKVNPQTGDGNIDLLDFATGIASQLIAKGNANTPIWAPDSDRIAYDDNSIHVVTPSSGENEIVVVKNLHSAFLQSWSPDGRYIVFTASVEGQSDPWVIDLQSRDRAAVPFFQTPSNEFRARVSPDGHWIAYVSNESGRDEVNVESFPKPGQKRRISANGGAFPEWRADGRELYYLEPSGPRWKLMAVRVETASSSFLPSKPEILFETPMLGNNPRRGQYAVFGKGDRFLLNVVLEEKKPRAISVVLNWPALLK